MFNQEQVKNLTLKLMTVKNMHVKLKVNSLLQNCCARLPAAIYRLAG
jgi:hypothetical protein